MGEAIRRILCGVGTVMAILPMTPPAPLGNTIDDVADAEAVRRDWEVVGKDLGEAIDHEITKDSRVALQS